MENKDIKRSKNFTDFDKNVLFEIVQKYSHIIENKKTDSTNVRKKNEAWDLISREFNASCQSGIRTAKQLHALYDGIKKKAIKNMLDDKKEIYKTGGGVFIPKSDILDTKIVETLSVQFQPPANLFDSSSSYLDENVILCDAVKESEIFEAIPNGENTEAAVFKSAVFVAESNAEEESTVQVKNNSDVEKNISHGTTPMKRKMFAACTPKLPENKNKYLSTISNRLVERKNFKDEADFKINNKKIKILEVEEKIKCRELEIKNLEFDYIKKKQEIELQHIKEKHALEMKLLEAELTAKELKP